MSRKEFENGIVNGFKVIRTRESEELRGTLVEMEHIKTGAQLAWLDNGCENKLFSATFKTLPWDDTGVFHILEHCVLAGSDNYPVKEPFLDLIKGSMNTFINAMTFSDKTMYPVSSKNEQDFINLTRVYLDAVFRPAIYHNESIFRQEGWHYEFKDDEPFYNGVVFNEMKGSFASVGTIIEKSVMRELFPDNTYRFVSGGHPAHITELTYEDFLRAHRDFYSPSNCRFYLDGDLPIERVLKIIDEEYLSKFERSDAEHEIPYQHPVASKEVTDYYEIGKDENETKKTHLAFGKVLSDWSERKRNIAYTLVSMYLAGDNEAPLKRAILEKGLAQDVSFSVDDGIYQPYYVLVFRNTEPSDKEEILKVYRETLQGILRDGVDKEALTGCINRFEFSLREPWEPAGLGRAIEAMSSWLYGGDPMLYLESKQLVKELREALDSDYYNRIIEELLDEEGVVSVTILPSKTKGDEEAKEENERVNKEYASFSDEEREEIKDIYDRMRVWQDTPDAEEAVATLPVLKISDVSPDPQWVEPEVSEKNGVKFIYEPIVTNGVVHVNMYFNLSDLNENEMQMATAMSVFMGLLPTSKRSAAELQKEKRKIFGKLNYAVGAQGVKDHAERAKPYFVVSFSALEENLEEAIELILEILTDSDFSAKDIMEENLIQSKEILYRGIMSAGNRFAARRVASHYTAAANIEEQVGGFEAFTFLKQMLDSFKEKGDEYVDAWRELASRIFVSSRLTIGETSTEKHEGLEKLTANLPKGEAAPEYKEINITQERVKEAILIPAGISFAALGANMTKYGFTHSGRFSVLSQIMSYGYLWDKIRVHGGAYGCGFNAKINGNMVFTSYRDPNPMNSLNVYKKAGEYIKEFADGEEDLTKYIISSIAGTDGLMTSAERGTMQEQSCLSGISYEDVCELRKEMLALTKEELAELIPLFNQAGEDGSICVIGNKDAINLDDSWSVYNL